VIRIILVTNCYYMLDQLFTVWQLSRISHRSCKQVKWVYICDYYVIGVYYQQLLWLLTNIYGIRFIIGNFSLHQNLSTFLHDSVVKERQRIFTWVTWRFLPKLLWVIHGQSCTRAPKLHQCSRKRLPFSMACL